jgi:hypothetical protein
MSGSETMALINPAWRKQLIGQGAARLLFTFRDWMRFFEVIDPCRHGNTARSTLAIFLEKPMRLVS